MAPSTFAMDYLNNTAKKYDSNAVPKQREIQKPNREKLKVVPGKNNQEKTLETKRLLGILACSLMVMILVVSFVFLDAKASEIKYNINKLNSKNSKLENEINLISTKIDTANSISSISEYAVGELGLGTASSSQYVVLSPDNTYENLADVIKEKIYG